MFAPLTFILFILRERKSHPIVSKEKTPGMVYIDYGANLFRKRVLDLVPEGQVYSLEDLFAQLIERRELLAYEVKERFYEIGSLEGLTKFRAYMERAEGQCSR